MNGVLFLFAGDAFVFVGVGLIFSCSLEFFGELEYDASSFCDYKIRQTDVSQRSSRRSRALYQQELTPDDDPLFGLKNVDILRCIIRYHLSSLSSHRAEISD